MTKSHRHQQVGLYDALVERAKQGKAGLSLGTMAHMFNFVGPEQVQDALDALKESGHITIDIGGRFPSMRLHKDRHKSLHRRERALVLSSGEAKVAVAAKVAEQRAAAAAKAVEPVKPAAPKVAVVASQPVSAVEASVRLEPALPEPSTITFTLPQKDYDALHDEMEASGLSISLACFCIQLIRTEMARRTSADAPKHKISAEILLAAQAMGKGPVDLVQEILADWVAARSEKKAA